MRGMADFWIARSGAKGRLWLPAEARATWLRWLTAPPQAAIWPACRTPGEVAEWLKAADCKSARASVRWFESSPLHQHPPRRGEVEDMAMPPYWMKLIPVGGGSNANKI